MNYIEVNLETTVSGIEILSNQLICNDILQFQITDPRDVVDLMENKESYQWDYIDVSVTELSKEKPRLTIFVYEEDDFDDIMERIVKSVNECKELYNVGVKIDYQHKDDSKWKDLWKKYTKTSKLSEKLVVKPTWEKYNPKNDELVIEIDPGMAFGTGSHETTSMCAMMLDEYINGDYQLPREDLTVIDVGCGSGILSIAAAMLGAKNVIGIDIDPIAVEVSEENIKLNKVEKVAKAIYGDLMKGLDFKGDIIAANLMADLVMMFSKAAYEHLNPNGLYITSGIILEKEDEVKEKIEEAGFKIHRIERKGQWCCIVGRKINESC